MKNKHHTTLNSYILFMLLSCGCLLAACSAAQNQPTTSSSTPPVSQSGTIPFDSIQKANIDFIVGDINGGIRNLGQPQKLAFPVYNPKDTIFYWMLPDGKSAHISIEFKLPNEVRWPAFYVADNELMYVRYRNMIDAPPNSRALESMIYLQDGKIIYCEERGGPLKPGEKPMAIQLKGASKTTRSYAEVEQDYKGNWELVYDFMKKSNVLPASFKK